MPRKTGGSPLKYLPPECEPLIKKGWQPALKRPGKKVILKKYKIRRLSPWQKKEKATAFFKAMEDTYGAARLKKQEIANAAAAASVSALDDFVASL